VVERTKSRKGKRADGEGTIYRRSDGLWVARLMIGYAAQGNPDVRQVTAKTQGECRKRLDALKQRVAVGLVGDVKAGRETVAAFLGNWLKSIEGTIEPGSLRRHRDNVHQHLIPVIGDRKLADLKPEHLVAMFAVLREKPVTPRGKKKQIEREKEKQVKTLSPRTVKYCFATIRRALDTAVDWGAVPRNVARAIKAPKVSRVEVKAPKPEEVVRLLETAEAMGERLSPLLTVAVYSGCRLGELLALKWSDVGLDTGRTSVQRTLVGLKGGKPELHEGGKTVRSRRNFLLSADALVALQAQKDRQGFERQALGDAYADHGLIFATPFGTPLDPANARKRLRAVLKEANLPEYTFHALRHAAATMILVAGVNPKVAADRLGHHSVAFTLDRYTHAVESLDVDAAERLQAMMKLARQKAI
jgi:integrase